MVELYMHEFNVIEKNDGLEIQIPQTAVTPPNGREFIMKAMIKVQGRIWTAHKYDKDNFPSSPHAHNYEDGTKLNLFTGEIFKNGHMTEKITGRALESIQTQLRNRGFKL